MVGVAFFDGIPEEPVSDGHIYEHVVENTHICINFGFRRSGLHTNLSTTSLSTEMTTTLGSALAKMSKETSCVLRSPQTILVVLGNWSSHVWLEGSLGVFSDMCACKEAYAKGEERLFHRGIIPLVALNW